MAAKQRAWTPAGAGRGESARLGRALAACATESDVVQVLYARLSHAHGFEVVDLEVLERDGWCRRTVVDHGVLQESRRVPVDDSRFSEHFGPGVTVVGHPVYAKLRRGRGTAARPIRTYAWVPIRRRRRLIGGVAYQMTAAREPSPAELTFLEKV